MHAISVLAEKRRFVFITDCFRLCYLRNQCCLFLESHEIHKYIMYEMQKLPGQQIE